jgi:GTPase involved in cell partitioning and DNA repair
MDWQVTRINQEVKRYDKTLFAHRNMNNTILILRKADRLEASDYNQIEPNLASLNPQLILALTDNWKANGKNCDRGIEPVMQMIRSMDTWSKEDQLPIMRKKREEEEEQKKRSFRNNVGALAADIRKDFAKATNDISTNL